MLYTSIFVVNQLRSFRQVLISSIGVQSKNWQVTIYARNQLHAILMSIIQMVFYANLTTIDWELWANFFVRVHSFRMIITLHFCSNFLMPYAFEMLHVRIQMNCKLRCNFKEVELSSLLPGSNNIVAISDGRCKS